MPRIYQEDAPGTASSPRAVSPRLTYRDVAPYLSFAVMLAFLANCYVPVTEWGWDFVPLFAVMLFVGINLVPGLRGMRSARRRLRILGHGVACLVVFAVSSVISTVFQLWLATSMLPGRWQAWALSVLACVVAEGIVFWNGIICVYATSEQLGLTHRVRGALFGMVPIANLVCLRGIIHRCRDEVWLEIEKELLDGARHAEQVCRTRYPVLLVHGVFFRDYAFPNYWGRIAPELERNGAKVFYGEHQSALSVPDSGVELAARIRAIMDETGCEKVNVIAHSKGGLDARWAISQCGMAPFVASLTTINTPHRGCEFADWLLDEVPESAQQTLATTYNAAASKLGDTTPDFMAAVRDLATKRVAELNDLMPDADGLVYRSVGSRLDKPEGGTFPLNLTYRFVKRFDGPNDGLVSEESSRWGESFVFLTPEAGRGISHGDVIDLTRENIPGFDVREFYVRLVSELAEHGL